MSSPERASQFGRNPEMFVVAIERLVHQYPCLLKLLNMTEEENRRERGRSKVGKEVLMQISMLTKAGIFLEYGYDKF